MSRIDNPVSVKADVGLGNVDNTSDANKPVSTATQTALNAKQATLISGTNIKTINGSSVLGSGNLVVAGSGAAWGDIVGTLSDQIDLQAALDAKADDLGADDNYVTDAEKAKLANLSGVNSGDQTLPVKATGAEVDTGTNDTKFLTPKAIEDSLYAKQAYADAKVAETITNGVTGIAPSQDAVFDALALKAAALGSDDNYVTDAEKTVIGNTSGTNTGDSATPAETATTVGALISGATAKVTPVDADNVAITDSAASHILKKVTWANIKATLKSYFDTLYAGVLGSDDNYVTDAEKVKLSNLSGTNTGDQTLPVKATGAEVNTGTDDAKFVTAKAMEDSLYAKEAYADAKVADAINDGTTTIAPSQNAVFDQLALKQPLDADLTTIAGLSATTDNFMVAAASAWASRTPAQAKTSLALVKADVGLGNVVNADTTTTANITDSSNKRFITDAQQTVLGNTSGTNTGDSSTPAETTTTIGTLISGATGKTTPVDADTVGLSDSAGSNVLKKLTWANIKATLKTYFDTLYPSGSGTSSGTNTGDQTISDATITTTDITTNNFTTAKHGFVPKGTNVGSFLKDDGTWATPTAAAAAQNPNVRVLTADYALPANSSLYFSSNLDDGGFTMTDTGAIFETG